MASPSETWFEFRIELYDSRGELTFMFLFERRERGYFLLLLASKRRIYFRSKEKIAEFSIEETKIFNSHLQ